MSSFAESDILRLDSLLRGQGPVCIAVHIHPDGDAIGSATALARFLRSHCGRDARIVMNDPPPETLDFLSWEELAADASRKPQEARELIASASLLICLDMNEFKRAGSLASALADSGATKILIDHHLDPDRASFDLVFSRTDISSTCELLYSLLTSLPGVKDAASLGQEVGTPLMTGMTTDTNNFANSVFPSTLVMASELLAAGVDRDAILLHLYNSYRENRLRAMGYCLSDLMKISPEGVAVIVMDGGTLRRFDLQDGETEGFVNLPLSLAKVRMSILLKEDEGFFRVSLRSRPDVAANELASACFHGGGHRCASGGRLYFPGDIADPSLAQDYVMNAAARFMRGEMPLEQ